MKTINTILPAKHTNGNGPSSYDWGTNYLSLLLSLLLINYLLAYCTNDWVKCYFINVNQNMIGLLWCHSHIELRLIEVEDDWSWGWLKSTLIEVNFDWSWG